jgi:hypothetical protein
MGCNIPRPTKRPKCPDNIDGVLGALTYKAIQERQETKRKIQEPERSPYNCPNCCAPIVKDYCEYCGTRFGFTMVKVDGVKKRDEIQRLKDALNGEKQILFADNRVVAEFHRFSSTAYELGDTSGTTTQYR